KYPPDRMRQQLEVFDWLVAKRDPKVSRNPVGFLVSSIQSDYSPPKGYVSPVEREQIRNTTEKRTEQSGRRQLRQEAEITAEAKAREEGIIHFWNSMSDEERKL